VKAYATYVAAVVVALLVVAAAPAAAAKRKVPQNFYGVNWDREIAAPTVPDAVVEAQFDAMAQTGVETMRTNFYWALAQQQPGAAFDHVYTDRIVRIASARRISVLPVVILAPEWARNDTGVFAPPRDSQEYAAYLTALIGRYGPNGTFWSEHPELPRRPIRHWQIWNEPHLEFQFTVAQDEDYAPRYGDLLKASYAAVKSADPGAKVVLAGLANSSWKILSRLYQKGRIKGNFDIAALHPYTVFPRGVTILSRRFRDVLRRYRDSRKQVWITELGLPASRGKSDSENFLQTTDRGMARFLEATYKRLASTRRNRRVGVARAYWYTWASPYEGEIFQYSGLFQFNAADGSLTAKPAYRTYRRSARAHQGCTKTAAGVCRR
jgi:hypothetical protein